MTDRTVVVRCYSGHTYAQEPRSFVWKGQEYVVAAVESVRRVLDRDSGEDALHFAVCTNDGQRFRLVYDERCDTWGMDGEGSY